MITESEFRALKEAVATAISKRYRDDPMDDIAELIRALTPEQAGITLTEGVVVPREPTDAMINAGDFKGHPKAHECRCCVLTWRAMLAAAQEPRK